MVLCGEREQVVSLRDSDEIDDCASVVRPVVRAECCEVLEKTLPLRSNQRAVKAIKVGRCEIRFVTIVHPLLRDRFVLYFEIDPCGVDHLRRVAPARCQFQLMWNIGIVILDPEQMSVSPPADQQIPDHMTVVPLAIDAIFEMASDECFHG
jgi:hypothetical protein